MRREVASKDVTVSGLNANDATKPFVLLPPGEAGEGIAVFGMLAFFAALNVAQAETTVPGDTPEIRAMAYATGAAKSVRGCPTTFQIKSSAKAQHAQWLEMARTRFPAAYNELFESTKLLSDQTDCIKAAVNFYCNIRRDDYVELTEQARNKLNSFVPNMKFSDATSPKECKNRSPL
jgi:hypothetical protein